MAIRPRNSDNCDAVAGSTEKEVFVDICYCTSEDPAAINRSTFSLRRRGALLEQPCGEEDV
jgi:hypothetical protein